MGCPSGLSQLKHGSQISLFSTQVIFGCKVSREREQDWTRQLPSSRAGCRGMYSYESAAANIEGSWASYYSIYYKTLRCSRTFSSKEMRGTWEKINLLIKQIRECHSSYVNTAPGSKLPRLIPNIPTTCKNIMLCHTLDNDTHQASTTLAIRND